MTRKALTRKFLVTAAVLAVFLGGVNVIPRFFNPYYKGPVSDHFDGVRFFIPENLPEKSWWDVWKWRLTRDRAVWPKKIDVDMTDIPPDMVKGDDLRVAFINHTTFLLQTEGLNILTDPILSERASPVTWAGPKRIHKPGIVWNALPKIDVVTISHSHYDHLDIPTLKRLVERDNPHIVVPLGVDAIIRNHIPKATVTALDWQQSYTLGNLKVHAQPAYHWSARTLWDRNKTLWASFVYELPAGNIYFSGDTGFASGKFFEEIAKKFGSFRFAMIDIGAYEPRWFMQYSHINPEEAVRVHRMLGAWQSAGMHFGTFQLSDEGLNDPTDDLRAAREAYGLTHDNFRAPRPGDAWMVR